MVGGHGHDPDRADAAGVLHRPARPATPGQPPHHRGLPRHAAAAARPSSTSRPARSPSQLDWDDLDATTISAFLNHLEIERHNSIRTRNVRLTAIRSLFSYAALRHPEHALLIQRVLAIPPKRFDKRIVTFLTATEVDALIAAPDQSRWEGRRDRVLMLLAVQTGLRVSELIGLNCGDVTLGSRRKRPLRRQRAANNALSRSPAQSETLLQAWLRERAGRQRRPTVPDPHRTAAQPRRRRAAGQHPHRDRRTNDARRCWARESTPTSCATPAP